MKPELKPFWINALNHWWAILAVVFVIWDIADRHHIDSKYTYDPRKQAGKDTIWFNDSTYTTEMHIDSVWYDPGDPNGADPEGGHY